MKPLGLVDPELLRTLVVVAETRSFSQAASVLQLAQSSVSSHIRRLEQAVGRRLLERTTHNVELNRDGEALLGYARLVLDLAERAQFYFSQPPFEGSLRFGFCDGIESEGLPVALAQLKGRHPGFQIRMLAGRVDDLLKRLDLGELDLVLGAKPAGHGRGEVLWRSPLVWLGLDSLLKSRGASVPLVARPDASSTRASMVNALVEARRAYTIQFESESFVALRAAALAGLGLTAFPREVVPAGMPVLSAGHGLPDLGVLEVFIATRSDPIPDVVGDFAAILRAWTPELFRPVR